MKKNEIDTTLLDKEEPVTVEDLQTFFRNNDYTTVAPAYNPSRADAVTNALYMRAKGHFHRVFEKKFTDLCKKRLKNFSKEHPVKVLAKADEDIITDVVMKVFDNPALLGTYIESFFDIAQEPIEVGLKGYAGMLKKEPEDLTDEEVLYVIDKVVDEFLELMMSNLIQSQSIPEIMGMIKRNGAHEDFNTNIAENYDLIDFNRKWEHLRTKIGGMLSFESLDKESDIFLNSENIPATDEEVEEVFNMFVNYLNDSTDQEIVRMMKVGLTQSDVAQRLGYKSQGAVSKRLKSIRNQFTVFMDTLKTE